MDPDMKLDLEGLGLDSEQLRSICGQFGDWTDLLIFIIAAYCYYGYEHDTLYDIKYILYYMFSTLVLILSICRTMWYCRITTWPAFIIPLSGTLITIFQLGVRFIKITLISAVIHVPEIAMIKITDSDGTYVLVNGNEVLGTIFSSILDKLTENCELGTVDVYDDVCAICLDDMIPNQGIYRVKACGHHYHGLCILRCMQSSTHICVQCRDEAAPIKTYNIPDSRHSVHL